MREYGTVESKFWTGETGRAIKRLGRDAQVMALYLMTCPSSNMIGLFYLPLPVMAHEIGMSVAQAEATLAQLAQVGYAKYDGETEIVWVIKMGFYQARTRSLKVQDKRWVSVCRMLREYARTPLLGEWMAVYAMPWSIPPLRGVLDASREDEELLAEEGPAGKAVMAEEGLSLGLGLDVEKITAGSTDEGSTKAALTDEGSAGRHAEEGHAAKKGLAPEEGAQAEMQARGFGDPSKPESREQRENYKNNTPLPPSTILQNPKHEEPEEPQQRQVLPVRPRTRARATANAKTTAKAGQFERTMAKASEAGLDTVSLAAAAGRALRGCGISDERMLPIVIAAFELECTRHGTAPAQAETLAIENWGVLQTALTGGFLLYPPSERKFFKMGLWADASRFPWDPQQMHRRSGL